jgi:hypothetical protein
MIDAAARHPASSEQRIGDLCDRQTALGLTRSESVQRSRCTIRNDALMSDATDPSASTPLSRPDLERLIARLIGGYVDSEGPIVRFDVPELVDAVAAVAAVATHLDRTRFGNVLQGAVRAAIDAHGPISDGAGLPLRPSARSSSSGPTVSGELDPDADPQPSPEGRCAMIEGAAGSDAAPRYRVWVG